MDWERDAERGYIAADLVVNGAGMYTYSEGDISTPFSGFKALGFGGRDNGIHAHEQYTELRTIWLQPNR